VNSTRWIQRLLRRRQVEADMREEMEFHREARVSDLVARGMDREEAARTARLEFGSAEAYREECRKELGYRPWDELYADLRFAVRSMKKNPGFAAATIAILALAIGVNGAFFSLYSNYVLKPLPIRGAERHFSVLGFALNGKSPMGWSPSEVEALRQSVGPAMEGLYSSDTFQVLALAPVQRQTIITSVSGNYFPLLGGTTALGRALTEAEEHEPVAVLSSSGAARFFPDRANPIGQTLRVRTTVLTVIGVTPPEFKGAVAVVPDFWVGIGMENALRGRPSTEERRRDLFGLLATDVPVERVQAVLTATAAHFSRPHKEAVARVELRRQQSVLDHEEIGAAAALVFAAFWTVLLIACANLANLHLARAAARTHEIAMRLSLGASRWRIVRQLLTESTFTALLGAAGGCVLAVVTVQEAQDYAISVIGVGGITMLPVSADWRVLIYSVVLGLAASLAFGLLPALEITTASLTLSTKREHSSFAGRIRPRRMRNLLIGGQVAASLVLLIIGGVLIRNIQRLDSVDPGYDLSRVFDLRLDQPTATTLGLLGQQPGVGAVTAVERVPLYGRLYQLPVTVGGRTTPISYNFVDHHYFETLALPVEGRTFTVAETSARAKVAVISQATARKLWATGSPLGQTFAIDLPSVEGGKVAGVYEVVGVVPDVVSGWLFEGKDSSVIYLPAAAGQSGIESAMVRIAGNPAKTVAAIREVCSGVTDATGCEPASLREISAMQRFPFQIAAGVAGMLGGLALLLTAIGLYSVASYSVVQRRREIGVLLALGASPLQVIRRILFEGWRCVVLGVAAGLPACLVLSELAASSIFQIRTFDLGTYLSVPALLIVIATLACAGPARRAARTDPMVSLREE
jgi:putative ABC transport system permease protein